MPLIHLTGHIDGPRRRDSCAAGLPAQIPLTGAEPGGLNFEVTPGPAVTGRWPVAERFDSRQAVKAHKARSDASGWAKAGAGVHPSIRVEEVDG